MEWEFDDSGRRRVTEQALGQIRFKLGKGDIDGALELFRESGEGISAALLANLDHDSRVMRVSLARLLLRANDLQNAARCAERGEDYALAARAYERAGNAAEAARCKALALDDPRRLDPGASNELLSLSSNDLPPRSTSDLLRSQEIPSPIAAQSYLKDAVRAWRQGLASEAKWILDGIPESHPEHVAGLLLVGELEMSEGHVPEALSRLTRATSKRPHGTSKIEAEAAYKLGSAFADAGLLPQASRAFDFVIGFDPNYKDAYQRLVSIARNPTPSPSPIPSPIPLSLAGAVPVVSGLPTSQPRSPSDLKLPPELLRPQGAPVIDPLAEALGITRPSPVRLPATPPVVQPPPSPRGLARIRLTPPDPGGVAPQSDLEEIMARALRELDAPRNLDARAEDFPSFAAVELQSSEEVIELELPEPSARSAPAPNDPAPGSTDSEQGSMADRLSKQLDRLSSLSRALEGAPPIEAALGRSFAFVALGPAELGSIASFARVQELVPGENPWPLARPGEAEAGLCVAFEGAPFETAEGPAAEVGTLSLLEPLVARRVRVAAPTRAVLLDREAFLDLAERHPRLGFLVARALLTRVLAHGIPDPQ
ncbi:MAG: hypothetical protein HYV07_23040 [Deltaproteobacteria bacterium]|nr:hypothetical protein [Deltaproteobacteria bacterium]